MAIFDSTLPDAGTGFQPVTAPPNKALADTLRQGAEIAGNISRAMQDRRQAQQEQEQASAFAGLFSNTLQREADVLIGQEGLSVNQSRIDELYADGTISEAEQAELQQLQQDRVALEDITNSRQRQVELRRRYASFVTQFPHLTKEARLMFGTADSRLDDIAEGNRGLVDKEAFEEIFGADYGAENITRFRQLQRFRTTREIGMVYGSANFQDFSNSFTAQVTADMYLVGQRINRLVQAQGSLRTDDIDAFNSQISTGYTEALQSIDAQVASMQQAGQFVSPEDVQALKNRLTTARDDVLKLTEGKDFATRIKNFNIAMDEMFKANVDVNVGPIARLFGREAGSGTSGASDIATLRSLLEAGPAIQAAELLPGTPGYEVSLLRQGAAEWLNFLNTYDNRAAANFISPAMSRQLAAVQATRVSTGVTVDEPEQIVTLIDLMEQGGTSDEAAEAINSFRTEAESASTRSNEVSNRLGAFVNNYALETEQFLSDVNGRIVEQDGNTVVMVSSGGGRFTVNQEATNKLQRTRELISNFPSVSNISEYNSMLDRYRNNRSTQIEGAVQELSEAVKNADGSINTQLLSVNLRQIKILYGLTEQEVATISSKIRSQNGSTNGVSDGEDRSAGEANRGAE